MGGLHCVCHCNNGSLGENNRGGGWKGKGGASLWAEVSTDGGSDNTWRQRGGRLCRAAIFLMDITLENSTDADAHKLVCICGIMLLLWLLDGHVVVCWFQVRNLPQWVNLWGTEVQTERNYYYLCSVFWQETLRKNL